MTHSSNASHGDSAAPSSDLLDFVPVPRKVKRPDGWTPELQREFIRRLAESGSPQQACIDMGKNVTGIEALYKVPGAESFRAAWDQAVRIGRRAQGLDCGPPHLGPVPGIQRRSPRNASASFAPEDDENAMSEEESLALLAKLFDKFVRKVAAERTERLAGRVVAADFYLRQVSFFEIVIDLMAEGCGMDAWQVLGDLRRGGHGILDIAQTPLSRALDTARREQWAAMGEPERPEHPPERYLSHDKDFSTEPLECIWGGEEGEKQKAEYAQRHADDAAAQAEWEAKFPSHADGATSAPLPLTGRAAQPCRGHGEQLGEGPAPRAWEGEGTLEEQAAAPLPLREREGPAPQAWEGEGTLDEQAAITAYREQLKSEGWIEDGDGNLWLRDDV